MNTTGIIAFDNDIIPIMRYINKVKAEATSKDILATSFSGWGFVNKAISDYIENADKNLILDFNESSKIIENSDVIIFNEARKTYEHEKIILDNLDLLSMKDKVISFRKIQNENIKQRLSHNLIHYDSIDVSMINSEDTTLSKIDVPVVFVSGICEQLNKLETALKLSEFFQRKSYKPLLITSKSYSNFFGGFSIPKFMTDTLLEKDKIIYFNKYIKSLVKEHKPDLIIIEIPGGIVKLNETIDNFFGTLHYEISESVEPDLTVLDIPFDYFHEEYFSYIDNLLTYRFNSEVNLFFINATMLDFVNKDIQRNISLVDVSLNTITKYIEKMKFNEKVCHMDYEFLSDKILNILEDNASYQAF